MTKVTGKTTVDYKNIYGMEEVMQEDKKVTGWVGWVALASFMLMFEGALQVIYGFAALFNQNWYASTGSSLIIFNLATWGWISLVLGLLLFLTGISLQNGRIMGRVFGLVFAVLGALYSLAFIAIAPIWSTLALVIYALVAYAILVHGKEMQTLAEAR